MIALLLILAIAGIWQLGLGCLNAVMALARRFEGRAEDIRSPAELWGFGLALGLAVNSWLLMAGNLCGISLGFHFSFGLMLLGWGVGGILLWKKTFPPLPSFFSQPPIVCTCQCFLLLIFLNLVVQSLLTPQHLWDERAIFGIKGIVLFEDHSLNSEVLRSPDFVQYHPRYPLLIPLSEQHVYSLLGHVDDRLSKLIFPLMFLALILGFAGVLSRHLTRPQAWVCAVLLATVPGLVFWEYGFLCGQADAPMACYHGLAVLCLWDWLRTASQRSGTIPQDAENPLPVILGGLFTGSAIFVKDEGIAFAGIDLAVFSILVMGRISVSFRRRLQLGAILLASVLLVVLPWFWHRQLLPKTGEMTYFDRLSVSSVTQGLGRLSWSVRHLFVRMFSEAGDWGVQWWALVLALFARPRRACSRSQLFLLLDILGALSALVLAALVAPTPVEEHLGGSSHRFLLQLVPVAVLFLAGQWGRTDSREETLPPVTTQTDHQSPAV